MPCTVNHLTGIRRKKMWIFELINLACAVFFLILCGYAVAWIIRDLGGRK